jgi:hypothetical protein
MLLMKTFYLLFLASLLATIQTRRKKNKQVICLGGPSELVDATY